MKIIAASAVLLILSLLSCSRSGLINKPAKVFGNIDIADGEYIRYGEYIGGDKSADWYFVTEKMTNKKGVVFYQCYADLISVKAGKKHSGRFTEWPISFLINGATGSTVESVTSLDPKDMKNYEKFGLGGLIYARYSLNDSDNSVKGTIRFLKNGITSTMNCTIKVKQGYPILDGWNADSMAHRLLDPDAGGISYIIEPTFMKDPIPLTMSFGRKNVGISTKAGNFRTRKLNIIPADPFLSKLLESLIKSASFYVEDSDRRLMIKKEDINSTVILEEISNISRH